MTTAGPLEYLQPLFENNVIRHYLLNVDNDDTIPFNASRCSCLAWVTSILTEEVVFSVMLARMLAGYYDRLAGELWPHRKRISSSSNLGRSEDEALPLTGRGGRYNNRPLFCFVLFSFLLSQFISFPFFFMFLSLVDSVTGWFFAPLTLHTAAPHWPPVVYNSSAAVVHFKSKTDLHWL